MRSRCGFSVVKRGNLMSLNVVEDQEWRGFCRFWMQKKLVREDAPFLWAVDTVQIVNCGVVKYRVRKAIEEDARGTVLLSGRVHALLEAEAGLQIDNS
jgi:hypothetical protein